MSVADGLKRTRLGRLQYTKHDLSSEENYKNFINKFTAPGPSRISTLFTENDIKFFENHLNCPSFSGLSPPEHHRISEEFNEDDLLTSLSSEELKKHFPLVHSPTETKKVEYEDDLIFWISKTEEERQKIRDDSRRKFEKQHEQHWKNFSPVSSNEKLLSDKEPSWSSVTEKITADVQRERTEREYISPPPPPPPPPPHPADIQSAEPSKKDDETSSAASVQLSNSKESSERPSTESSSSSEEAIATANANVSSRLSQKENLNNLNASFDRLCHSLEQKQKQLDELLKKYSRNAAMATILKQGSDVAKMVNTKFNNICKYVSTNGVNEQSVKVAGELEQHLQRAIVCLIASSENIPSSKPDFDINVPTNTRLEEKTAENLDFTSPQTSMTVEPDNVLADENIAIMEAEQAYSSDAKKLPAHLNGRILPETHQFYTTLKQQLDSYDNLLKSFRENDLYKKYRIDLIGRSKLLLNVISSTNFKKSLRDLIQFLKGAETDNKNLVAKHEKAALFCLCTISDTIVKKIEMESSDITSPSLFILAAVSCWLSSNFEPFKSLLLGSIYKRCPSLIPFDLPKEGLSDEEYLKSVGYEIDSEGKSEDISLFVRRVESKARFLAALSIVFPATSSSASAGPQRTSLFHRTPANLPPNPFGLRMCWNLIANISNLPPVHRLTSSILYEVLQTSGFHMKQHYKDQFERLLIYLEKSYMQKIAAIRDESKSGGHYRLLEILLKEKDFKIPEGYSASKNLFG